MRRGFSMPLLPALEFCQRVFLSSGAANLNQRMLRNTSAFGRGWRPAACTRWLHARRFAFLLLVLRRPRRIAEPFLFVSNREIQQRVERARMAVDARVAIANRLEAIGHCLQREICRVARVDLAPGQRG